MLEMVKNGEVEEEEEVFLMFYGVIGDEFVGLILF